MGERRFPHSGLELGVKLQVIDPPRVFQVGGTPAVAMKDCARIELAPDEQVTFVTPAGGEYDVARKSWGFYATPSLNGRLPAFGLRPALVKSSKGRYYVFLIEKDKETECQRYLEEYGHKVLFWLDNDSELEALERTRNKGDCLISP